MDGRVATPIQFADVLDKPTTITFDEPHTSSDGGAILLKAVDQKLGLIDVFEQHIQDTRQPGKVQHTVGQLVEQRIFGIACGYADCNDAATLAGDPVMRLLAGRTEEDQLLASQPTLSRFENSIDYVTLLEIGCGLAQRVIDHQQERRGGKRKPRRITIDMDPTDDPTHGQQCFAFFNGHYDNWCYLPMGVFVTFDDEPEQYLVGTILRPGNAHATLWASWVLRRLVDALRQAWPGVKIRVRLDGGFASPKMFELLEWLRVKYIVAMAENSRLSKQAERLMKKARRLQKRTGQTARFFGECMYAARSWKKKQRRVVIKAEVVTLPGKEPRDNCRFVVTNERCKPEKVYQHYRDRGDVENRIKELNNGVDIGRTSCHDFAPNCFRVLLATAAYMLIQALRERIADPQLRRAQVWTLRERLLKVAARVRVTWRRIHFALPETFAFAKVFAQLARAFGAVRVVVT
jgi:hypothetical protein